MRRFVLLGILAACLLAGAASSNAPAVSTAGSAMVVDGHPYFPVFTWAACEQDIERDLDRDHRVHGARRRCGSEADFLASLGQRAYYVPSVGGGLEGDPRLLGYTQPDEPDGHGIGPAQLEDVPGRVAFMTLTAGFLRALPRYADPAARDLYGAYRAKADMFGWPSTRSRTCAASRRSHRSTRSSAIWSRSPRASRRSSGWRQATSKGRAARPSRRAARAEAWLAVAGGARGLGWFTYGGRAEGRRALRRRRRRRLDRRNERAIQSLAPMLLSPSVRGSPRTTRIR